MELECQASPHDRTLPISPGVCDLDSRRVDAGEGNGSAVKIRPLKLSKHPGPEDDDAERRVKITRDKSLHPATHIRHPAEVSWDKVESKQRFCMPRCRIDWWQGKIESLADETLNKSLCVIQML